MVTKELYFVVSSDESGKVVGIRYGNLMEFDFVTMTQGVHQITFTKDMIEDIVSSLRVIDNE